MVSRTFGTQSLVDLEAILFSCSVHTVSADTRSRPSGMGRLARRSGRQSGSQRKCGLEARTPTQSSLYPPWRRRKPSMASRADIVPDRAFQ